MKKNNLKFNLLIVAMFAITSIFALPQKQLLKNVAASQLLQQKEQSESLVKTIPLQKTKKQIRKEKRTQKRISKLKSKLLKFEKRMKKAAGDLFSNHKIRLGAMMLLISIGLAVLIWLNILGGFFGWISTLFAVIGVILVIIGLLQSV